MATKKQLWMPHPAHLIVGRDCKFHLATYVGGVIISTVGEYFPDSRVREILAKAKGIKIKGKGDEWDFNYIKHIGYETIGYDRKYETMTFKAKKSEERCCPYKIDVRKELDGFGSYNTADAAALGHYKILKKFSNSGK